VNSPSVPAVGNVARVSSPCPALSSGASGATHRRHDLGRSPRLLRSHRGRWQRERSTRARRASTRCACRSGPHHDLGCPLRSSSPIARARRSPRDTSQVSDVHETVDRICRRSRLRDDRPVHAGRCRSVLRWTEAWSSHKGDPPWRAARVFPLCRQPEVDVRNANQSRHQTSGRLS